MTYPYDLSVTTLFSLQKPKHRKAGEMFRELGLQNIRKRKVILHALLYEPDAAEFSKMVFPCDVRIHTYHNNSCSHKQYLFFSENMAKIAGEAPWHIQVDDDSFTDVDQLCSDLDLYYSHEDRLYLTAYDMYDLVEPLMKIAQDMGYGHISIGRRVQPNAFSKFTRFTHEWECAVRSDAAIKSMAGNKDALEFLRRAGETYNGLGDHAMAFAAAICKIAVTPSVLLSHTNAMSDFTLSGGHLCHIHYTNDDSANEARRLLNIERLFKEKFTSRPLVFGSRLGMKGMAVFTKRFTLAPFGQITNYDNRNESRWELKGDTLTILGSNGHATSRYKLTMSQLEAGLVTGVYCSDLSYTNLFLSTDTNYDA